jgi:two-component system nitrate/nitrite response regulator NarL
MQLKQWAQLFRLSEQEGSLHGCTRMKAIRVQLLAPDRLLRAGLCRILDDANISVCGAATTLSEGLKAIARQGPPDLVLADWAAGDNQRPADIRSLRQSLPQVRVVALADRLSIGRMAECFAAGAHGYLLNNISSAALKHSLALVMLGEKVFPSALAAFLANPSDRVEETSRPFDLMNRLSPREIAILRTLGTGLPNKVLAHQLGITESTVKVHLKGIMRKIRVSNRTQAAVWAITHAPFLSRLSQNELRT